MIVSTQFMLNSFFICSSSRTYTPLRYRLPLSAGGFVSFSKTLIIWLTQLFRRYILINIFFHKLLNSWRIMQNKNDSLSVVELSITSTHHIFQSKVHDRQISIFSEPVIGSSKDNWLCCIVNVRFRRDVVSFWFFEIERFFQDEKGSIDGWQFR